MSSLKLQTSSVVLILLVLSGAIAQDWVLVWGDEFDQPDLSVNWDYDYGCGGFGNDELQCYVESREENARVENGSLIIRAILEEWNDGINYRNFTSAQITSKFDSTYGKFEIRAKLPRGKHLWPAFWMMPRNSDYGGWPASGEIDMMEYRGQVTNTFSGTGHFGPSWDSKGAVGTGDHEFEIDFSTDFHTFGFHWDEYAIRWIVDGQQFHSEGITKNFWPGFYEKDGEPFDKPFYIILNLAVGGTFFPSEIYGDFSPEDSIDWEQPTLEVDWVRVYKWQ